MTNAGGLRMVVVVAVVGAVVLLTGCQATVAGTAVRPEGAAELEEADLDAVLLPIGALNETVGATDMEVTSDSEEMGDHSDEVSDPDCVGAIFSAEDSVYAGSEWTAMRDQVAAEPGDDNEHWVQQTAVLFPGEMQAQDFVEESRSMWDSCAGDVIAIGAGATTYLWELQDIRDAQGILAQTSSQEDSGGWSCQHAISAVSNVVVEAWACGYTISDQAVDVATALIANVES
ncbi:sensor domain-containing protein [Mycolicibacterium arseniciresistens]|uniref:Sensor domain-containing protein n=1 Tax=Mycolicibacterium arseniciresistens TaxID=3062257 RepID=A0ABT8UQT2_9MYCO|nr:sensor domain-containing protein [Mycolicibacterium arseniciresistens]MDO3640148.1 sensor domain-containing protein [Mycolicibacterium arseniciresistens]